jgi:hypothetical protein
MNGYVVIQWPHGGDISHGLNKLHVLFPRDGEMHMEEVL